MTSPIPNLPATKNIVDEKGNLTDTYYQFLSQLITALQSILTDQGIFLPPQTSANITQLNTSKSTRAILYNSDTNKAEVCLNGTFHEITTS